MRQSASICFACVLASLSSIPPPASHPASGCHPQITGVLTTQGPVDAVRALSRSAAVLLVGERRGEPQYLPHDQLVLVDTHRLQVRRRWELPAYTTPPGLAVLEGGREGAVVVDDRLLLLLPSRGAIIERWHLDIQAVGWPAAVVGAGNRLYLAGQPQSSSGPAATLEALILRHVGQPPHLAWRQRLGLTHAGLWLGLAGPHTVASFLPDPHDVAGSVAIWSARNGGLLGSYAVPGPALAVDPALDLIFVGAGGRIYARTLRRGDAVAETAGLELVAVDGPRHLVLLVRERQVVVATARTLRPLGTIQLAGARALGLGPGGTILLIGRTVGLVRVDLRSCAGP